MNIKQQYQRFKSSAEIETLEKAFFNTIERE